MATVVCRVAAGISKSTTGECEYTDMGDSLCQCNTACRRGDSGDMGVVSDKMACENTKGEGEY